MRVDTGFYRTWIYSPEVCKKMNDACPQPILTNDQQTQKGGNEQRCDFFMSNTANKDFEWMKTVVVGHNGASDFRMTENQEKA